MPYPYIIMRKFTHNYQGVGHNKDLGMLLQQILFAVLVAIASSY